MSERLAVVRLALLVALAIAHPLIAQDELGALRARRDSVAARATVAESTWRRLNRQGVVAAETIAVADLGLRLRISPAGLERSDVDSVVAGLRLGARTLLDRFGAGGRALMDTGQWSISDQPGRIRFVRPLYINAGRGAGRIQWGLDRPIRPTDVEEFILAVAGDRLAYRSAVIGGYAGRGFSLSPRADRLADVAREMSLSPAAPLRRCIRGSLPDCRRVVTPATGDSAFATWYDADGHRAAVLFSATSLPPNDTVRRALKQGCLDGRDADCVTLAGRLAVRQPYTNLVRFTLVEHALDAGGPGTIDTLLAATSGDPVALLSRATGVNEDSLVAGWQRAAASALATGRSNPFPGLLTSVMWAMILLGITSRQRQTV